MSHPTLRSDSQVADKGPFEVAHVPPFAIFGSIALHARCNLAILPRPSHIQVAYARIGATVQSTTESKRGSDCKNKYAVRLPAGRAPTSSPATVRTARRPASDIPLTISPCPALGSSPVRMSLATRAPAAFRNICSFRRLIIS